MKKIEVLEKLESFEHINSSLYYAYEDACRFKNNTLNFAYHIKNDEVVQIVDNCKTLGIKSVTVSSTYTNLLDILNKFEECGCKVTGLTKVKSGYGSLIPAMKVKIF